jgi:hypothetical protein
MAADMAVEPGGRRLGQRFPDRVQQALEIPGPERPNAPDPEGLGPGEFAGVYQEAPRRERIVEGRERQGTVGRHAEGRDDRRLHRLV